NGQGVRKTTRSGNGGYEFTGLPSGEFSVRVTVPPGLAGGPTEGLVRLSDPRACDGVAFTFHPDTKVAGTITSMDGKPLEGVPVSLADADSWTADHPKAMTARTDEAGTYTLIGAPPGRCVLGVNVADSVDGLNPYPRTIYPGAGEPPAVLTVETGVPTVLASMAIRGPLERLRFDVIVVREGGTPAANSRVEL